MGRWLCDGEQASLSFEMGIRPIPDQLVGGGLDLARCDVTHAGEGSIAGGVAVAGGARHLVVEHDAGRGIGDAIWNRGAIQRDSGRAECQAHVCEAGVHSDCENRALEDAHFLLQVGTRSGHHVHAGFSRCFRYPLRGGFIAWSAKDRDGVVVGGGEFLREFCPFFLKPMFLRTRREGHENDRFVFTAPLGKTFRRLLVRFLCRNNTHRKWLGGPPEELIECAVLMAKSTVGIDAGMNRIRVEQPRILTRLKSDPLGTSAHPCPYCAFEESLSVYHEVVVSIPQAFAKA